MRTQVMLIASMAAGGCGFSSPAKPVDGHMIDTTDDGQPDGPIDAMPDAAQQDFGSGAWTVHVPTLPTAGVTLPAMIDTGMASPDCMTTAMWTDASQPDTCFIVGTTIDTDGDVKVHGPRPLVLVATDAITIDKSIDVASHRGMPPGPGANWSGCGSPGAANRTSGGGGGAGGTYITTAGSGGPGDNGASAAGLVTAVLSTPAMLHGGCPGSAGGTGSSGPQSQGANGGGAIYLVAGNSISISSVINASGSGASAGGHATGGGGAGSGGTVVLYAPMITGNGKLIANGGGGAGGGDDNSNGATGGDPTIGDPGAQATGGNGPGGDGGDGYSTTDGASIGIGGNSGEGGGGGGGGAGYIRSNVTLTDVVASPAVDVVP